MSIKGNTVGTTMPRSDWNQTDHTKADYIKNKPVILGDEDVKKLSEATIEENERLQLTPEGMSSNYYITSGGWKRILVCIRSNAGIVNLALSCNNGSGRTFQNVTFGYSMHVDHPSVKGTGKPFITGDGPILYQLVNNTFGEEPNQTELSRLFRIDKVRIAWPLSWDETVDANTNNRYTNPVNTYLDIHVAGDVEAVDGGVQLMTNILAKSYNHNTAAILEETDAPMSEDGYVLGLDDVKCQTKELVLQENGMFMIPGHSQFGELASGTLTQLVKETVTVAAGERIGDRRASVSKVSFDFGDVMGSENGGTTLVARAAYAHNLLYAPRTPISSQGVTATKLHSGIYCLNGTATSNALAWLYNHEAGDQYPVRLLAGHTYYVSGCVQLRLASSPDATDGYVYWNGYQGNSSAVLTRQYTPDTDMYILRAAVFFYKGVTYDNYLYYPQVTEDGSLVVKDLNVDAAGYPLRDYKTYKTQAAANGIPALSYAAWLQKNVLPEDLYSPAPLVAELPFHGAYSAGLDITSEGAWGDWHRDPYDDTDEGPFSGFCSVGLPQLALYRSILDRADYLDAWQITQGEIVPCESVTVAGVFRRPVMAGGKLANDLDAGGHKMTGLATPVQDTDAATKGYVDVTIAAQAATNATESLLNTIYPVGSIYMSINATSPATLFGGTWERIQDRFLLAAGSSYAAGATGGEATHTLTVSEMPSHNHGMEFSATAVTAGGDYNSYGVGNSNYFFPSTYNRGGGAAHNNMPPYLAVYMWKRTA